MVGPDFVLEVEVYCSVPAEDPPSSKPSTPIKMFKKLRSKVHGYVQSHRSIFVASQCHNQAVLLPIIPPHLVFLLQDHVDDSPALISSVPLSPYTPHTLSHHLILAGHTQLGLKDISGACRFADN